MDKLLIFFFLTTLISVAYAAEGCPSNADILGEVQRVESILNFKEYLGYKVVYGSVQKDLLSGDKMSLIPVKVHSSVSKLSSSAQNRYHNNCCYDMYADQAHQPFALLCLGK